MRTLLAACTLVVLSATARLAAKDTCLECHQGLEGNLQQPAKKFADDVHRRAGFRCVDCHGGDASLEDPHASMSRARGFTGKVARTAVPRLCARCHSDANLIHKFKPQQRVDQFAQYQTSVHGKRLATGDAKVANCIDCHGVHDIRDVKHPLSPVHPLRLPETCARCHADKQHMSGYKIPTTQFDEYRKSVHWEALAKRRDLSAPSCASCHGNHGATPPQVSSVAAVCGTCHALTEDLYQRSPHQPVFSGMGMAGCVTCHSNHEISAPSDKLLMGDGSACGQCHDAESAGGKTAAGMHKLIQDLDSSLRRSAGILERARLAGMEVSESRLKLQEAHQALVQARVAVHAFKVDSVAEPVKQGLAIAETSYQAGEAALRELNYRRIGLLVSLAAIGLTIVGLWVAIRRLEAPNAMSGITNERRSDS